MKIEVLGTGCYRCIALESELAQVLAELGMSKVRVERVSDESTIRRIMPLDAIPGLVIDGHLVHSGEVPSRDELRQWLKGQGSDTRRRHLC